MIQDRWHSQGHLSKRWEAACWVIMENLPLGWEEATGPPGPPPPPQPNPGPGGTVARGTLVGQGAPTGRKWGVEGPLKALMRLSEKEGPVGNSFGLAGVGGSWGSCHCGCDVAVPSRHA